MGSGKSTWVKENCFEEYTLSADQLRIMASGKTLGLDGELHHHNDGKTENFVWEHLLFPTLENRMKQGAFTIIDATHAKTSAMNAYKKLVDKYRYRVFVVDFSNIELEEVLKRNANREPYKVVPEEAVINAYTRMETEYVPSFCKVISPSMEDFNKYVKWHKQDYNHYSMVTVIGDIHGSYHILLRALARSLEEADLKSDPVSNVNEDDVVELVAKSNILFIFAGDYFDRGNRNADTFRLVNKISKLKNVILLTGNHEKHLFEFAYSEDNPNYKPSRSFKRTREEFIWAGIKPKDARELYRRLQQVAYFEYAGNDYLVTHGGIMPTKAFFKGDDNLIFYNTDDFIKGTGSYEDNIDKIFTEYVEGKEGGPLINIHGHRNLYRYRSDENKYSYNLEGQVEFGGFLRSVYLFPKEDFRDVRFGNFKNSFTEKEYTGTNGVVNKDETTDATVEEFLDLAKEHNHIEIQEQNHDTVSVNFTRQAFRKSIWDEITVHARGLFINTKHNEIIARGYNKFFYPGERTRVQPMNIVETMKFPVTAYIKENGFLGLVSYDKFADKLRFFTKKRVSDSARETDMVVLFEKMARNLLSEQQLQFIAGYSKEHGVTFAFEVININEDPHIIDYEIKEQLILLDVIYNTLNFEKLPYNQLIEVNKSEGANFKLKQVDKVFDNWTEYFEWYTSIKDTTADLKHEGWVIEDSNKFMLKEKTTFYNNWKRLREVLHKIAKGNYHLINGSHLFRAEDNLFVNFLKSLPDAEREAITRKDIIKLRDKFFKNKER